MKKYFNVLIKSVDFKVWIYCIGKHIFVAFVVGSTGQVPKKSNYCPEKTLSIAKYML